MLVTNDEQRPRFGKETWDRCCKTMFAVAQQEMNNRTGPMVNHDKK